MITDLGPTQNYLFPLYLATTDLCPDILVFSNMREEVIILGENLNLPEARLLKSSRMATTGSLLHLNLAHEVLSTEMA